MNAKQEVVSMLFDAVIKRAERHPEKPILPPNLDSVCLDASADLVLSVVKVYKCCKCQRIQLRPKATDPRGNVVFGYVLCGLCGSDEVKKLK